MKREETKFGKHHKMVNIKGETNVGLGFCSKEERGVVQAKEVGGEQGEGSRREGRDFEILPYKATSIIYDLLFYRQRKNPEISHA